MKQNVSPAVVVSIVAVVLIIVGAIAYRAWIGPSAPVAAGGVRKPHVEKPGPDANELKQIEEWKKTHPGASTKY